MSGAATEILVSLPIADRRRAMAFYRDTFGFELVGTPEADGVPEPLMFRLDGHTLLALIPGDGLDGVLGARELAPTGTSECLLGVTLPTEADVTALVERVRNAGGAVVVDFAHQEWGYTGICADPDGHAWQITAEPSPTP